MGRSPFFAIHVKPLQKKNIIPELEDIFEYFFKMGEVVYYEDDTQTATLRNENVYVRITHSHHTPILTLERSCSTYQKLEDHFPEKQHTYQVTSAIRYKFKNKHSWGGEPFYYHVLELQNTDDNYYTTFCIKTDGAILNIESMSLRGYLSHIEVAPSIEQLRVGS